MVVITCQVAYSIPVQHTHPDQEGLACRLAIVVHTCPFLAIVAIVACRLAIVAILGCRVANGHSCPLLAHSWPPAWLSGTSHALLQEKLGGDLSPLVARLNFCAHD